MSAINGIDWNQVDIAVPSRVPNPGIQMAGFHHRDVAPVDIAMIPHPSVMLLFDLSDNGVAYDVMGNPVTGNAVVGLSPGAIRVTGSGTGDVLQVRLSPVIAGPIFEDPELLGGSVTPLAALWGRRAATLHDQLRAAPSWDVRFALILEFLQRGPRRFGVAPEVAYAWGETVRQRGRLRIDALASETGWSRQRLWSRFRTQIGLSPKQAAELIRFDHAAHLLAAGHSPVTAAFEAGYADQSHLHRQAKTFAHISPTAVSSAPWLAIDDIAWPAR
jgi:AraC-like DNA-binding protein